MQDQGKGDSIQKAKNEEMKKCYIAGKIGDLPETIYKLNFENAKKEVEALGFIPISPVDLPHNHGKTYTEYMQEDLISMFDCEVVYCLRNWRHSLGATCEINLATFLGKKVIHKK